MHVPPNILTLFSEKFIKTLLLCWEYSRKGQEREMEENKKLSNLLSLPLDPLISFPNKLYVSLTLLYHKFWNWTIQM
jgi:hypothetical protein